MRRITILLSFTILLGLAGIFPATAAAWAMRWSSESVLSGCSKMNFIAGIRKKQ